MSNDQLHRALGAVDWAKLLDTAVTGTTNILTARYAVPPAGTVIQAPNGSYIQRVQTGVPLTLQNFPGVGNSGLGTWLLLGGVGLAAILLLKGRR